MFIIIIYSYIADTTEVINIPQYTYNKQLIIVVYTHFSKNGMFMHTLCITAKIK